MGQHLDVAAEQTSFLKHDGLDANSLTISRTIHALPITMCKEGKGQKGKGKDKTEKGETKGRADDSYFAGECWYCGKGGHKKAQCRKQKKDQGGTPPAATIQAVESASSERNARNLVDSSADEHACPTNFASATPLRPAKGGML